MAPYVKLKLDALHRRLAPARGIGAAPAAASSVRSPVEAFPLIPQPTSFVGTLKAMLKKVFVAVYARSALAAD